MALAAMTPDFVTPPRANTWTLGPSTGAPIAAAVDIGGPVAGVRMLAPVGGSTGVWTQPLAAPGGAHVVVMYVSARAMPTDDKDVRTTAPGLVVMGATHFCEIYLGYDGDETGVKVIGHARENADYFAGSATVAHPWALYKGGSPFSGGRFRLTFDDTDLKVERFQPGGGGVTPGQADGNEGSWEPIWLSSAHTVGAIQSVGISVRSDVTSDVDCTVLSYEPA